MPTQQKPQVNENADLGLKCPFWLIFFLDFPVGGKTIKNSSTPVNH